MPCLSLSQQRQSNASATAGSRLTVCFLCRDTGSLCMEICEVERSGMVSFCYPASTVVTLRYKNANCLFNAMHGQNINLPVCVVRVCLCVRHTFCQLACRSDPSTDFYS